MLIDLDNFQSPFQVDSNNLNALNFRAYHCTRAFPEDIKLHGLKCFNLESRLNYVQSKLIHNGISSTLIAEYFIEVRKYLTPMQLRGRENNVCFCLNKELIECGGGCESLFKYFGGEAVYRVAEYSERFPEIKAALETIGTPLLITASIGLKTASEDQKRNVLNFLSGQSKEKCEVFIKEHVASQNILSAERHNLKV